MAGIGESEKSLSAARTLLAEVETTMSRVEKRTAALNAIKFSEQISAGNTSLKETEEIYGRLEGDVDSIAEELNEIAGRTEKAKTETIEWADQVGNVSKNLLGISMPALSINGLLSAAVSTTIDWYNHTFDINRKMYDINASLGEAGTKGVEFEGIISDTALAFHAQFDEVRNVADGLADIGMNGDDIKDTLDDVFALTRNWSDVTPEKQMSLMSDYMKEFGMNGKEAWATMNSLYVTSQDLRKDLPNLDIQKFVDQTQSVALSMRKYGLETQDAIAMTSTLARLGVEQARIGEIAETIGGAGIAGSAAETAYTAQRLQRGYQTKLRELQDLGVRQTPEEQERMDYLSERLATMGEGITAAMGALFTADAADRMKAQMGLVKEMMAVGGAPEGSSIEAIIGTLSQLDLPGIGKLSPQAAEEFGKAMKASVSKDGVTIDEALNKQLTKTIESEEAKAKEAAKQRDTQIESAKKVADATITTADKLSIMQEDVGNIARFLLEGKKPDTRTPEEKAAATTLRKTEKARLLEAAGGYEAKRTFDLYRQDEYGTQIPFKQPAPPEEEPVATSYSEFAAQESSQPTDANLHITVGYDETLSTFAITRKEFDSVKRKQGS